MVPWRSAPPTLDRAPTVHPGEGNLWEALRAFPILSFAVPVSSGWKFSQQEPRNHPAYAVLTHRPLKMVPVIQSGGKTLCSGLGPCYETK